MLPPVLLLASLFFFFVLFCFQHFPHVLALAFHEAALAPTIRYENCSLGTAGLGVRSGSISTPSCIRLLGRVGRAGMGQLCYCEQ